VVAKRREQDRVRKKKSREINGRVRNVTRTVCDTEIVEQNQSPRPQCHADNAGQPPLFSYLLTSSYLLPSLEEERKKESKKEVRARVAETVPTDWPPDYREVFWRQYPHKVGKPKALASLDRIGRGGKVKFLDLMAGLARYTAGKPADRSWLNPATFLNQERWNDQPQYETGGTYHAARRRSPLAEAFRKRRAELEREERDGVRESDDWPMQARRCDGPGDLLAYGGQLADGIPRERRQNGS
jgi:hypothetical protein